MLLELCNRCRFLGQLLEALPVVPECTSGLLSLSPSLCQELPLIIQVETLQSLLLLTVAPSLSLCRNRSRSPLFRASSLPSGSTRSGSNPYALPQLYFYTTFAQTGTCLDILFAETGLSKVYKRALGTATHVFRYPRRHSIRSVR